MEKTKGEKVEQIDKFKALLKGMLDEGITVKTLNAMKDEIDLVIDEFADAEMDMRIQERIDRHHNDRY